MPSRNRRDTKSPLAVHRLGGFLCVVAAVLWVLQAFVAAPRQASLAPASALPGLKQVVIASASIWAEDAEDRRDTQDAEDDTSGASDPSDSDDDSSDEDDESEVALLEVGLAPLSPPPGTTLPIVGERTPLTVWSRRLPRPVERG